MYLSEFNQSSSQVTFPQGQTQSSSHIVAIIERPEIYWLILNTTPVHPRDFRWPDQPADKAWVKIDSDAHAHSESSFQSGAGNQGLNMLDAVKILCCPQDHNEYSFYVDQEIHFSKHNQPKDSFLCVGQGFDKTLLQPYLKQSCLLGAKVQVHVDQLYRHGVSIGHTLGHLFSFALNQAVACYWHKPMSLDERGFPNFIGFTQSDSKVSEYATLDSYRLGKSLRKKGFNTQLFLDHLTAVESECELMVNQWIQQKPEISMLAEGPLLGDTRVWHCRLGAEVLSMSCGGTHPCGLDQQETASISLVYDSDEKSLKASIAQLGSR